MKKLIAVLLVLLLISNVAIIVLIAQNNRLLRENLENSGNMVLEEEQLPGQKEEQNISCWH